MTEAGEASSRRSSSQLRAGGDGAVRELATPLQANKATSDAESQVLPTVQADFETKQQLQQVLSDHRYNCVDVHVPDIIDMFADMRGVTRAKLLETATMAWFYYALGFRVLEAECKEQASTDDSASGLLLFRVKLDANHDYEVSRLSPGEDLPQKIRGLLIEALPGDIAAKGKSNSGSASMEQMVQISWTKSGSIELGGVAALGLVMMIVMAIGVGMIQGCQCCGICPCMGRHGRIEGLEYANVLRELRDRGADFEVNPDGSATLKVPPYRDVEWRCPDCTIL